MKLLGTDTDFNVLKWILSALPNVYKDVLEANEIQKQNARELELNGQGIHDMLEQLFIESATWGLSYWEKEYGIDENTKLSYAERRSNLKAKKRSQGTVTKEHIKAIALSYTGGAVEVTEVFGNYEIDVKFTDAFGVPSNLEGCKKIIREMIPAHLNVTYTFRYTLWADINTVNNTWEHINSLNNTWEQVENGGLLDGNNN